ncbi:MAG: lysine exporter LysO family protein [Candidatus Coprenecus sp.]
MLKLLLFIISGGVVGLICKRWNLHSFWAISLEVSIYLLLFLLGCQIGGNNDIFRAFDKIGLNALIVGFSTTAASMLAGWGVWRCFHRGKSVVMKEMDHSSPTALFSQLKASLKIILCLVAGIVAGMAGCNRLLEAVPFDLPMIALYFLLFCVGASLGSGEQTKNIIKGISPALLVLPVASIAASLAISALVSPLVKGASLYEVMAIGSGMGYYSLSSVLITTLKEPAAGIAIAAELGTTALLANIIRESITLIGIPFMARYFSPYAPVAAAGATAMDVCMPLTVRCVGESIVPACIICGFLTDFSVPFLVSFFCSL